MGALTGNLTGNVTVKYKWWNSCWITGTFTGDVDSADKIVHTVKETGDLTIAHDSIQILGYHICNQILK